MKNIKHNIYVKLAAIIVLTLLLLIPSSMVMELIREREQTQEDAINEVSYKWGSEQTLTGPYLSVPYYKYVKRQSEKDSSEQLVRIKEFIYFLPQELNIEGDIQPEKRYRGLYEVVVYESKFTIQGYFSAINLKAFEINPRNILMNKASLNFGMSDLKGIESQISLSWNDSKIPFNSGLSSNDIATSGIHASVPLSASDSLSYNFNLSIDLKGSQQIAFIPVGKTTDVSLTSPWTSPSFSGTYLPDDRQVNEEGFTAKWNILHLNRNYPQAWTSNDFSILGSSFGVDLLLPVDRYRKSMRVAKYSILFLVLTFMVFFFVEILQNVFIHPIQYLLVGIALIVFFSLLLAFSEYMIFNWAYTLAAMLTLILITLYTSSILKSRGIAGLISSVLFILYTFIFTIIQLEDYALLIGSLGIFIVLAIVMYFSRKIDWYAISIGPQNDQPKNN